MTADLADRHHAFTSHNDPAARPPSPGIVRVLLIRWRRPRSACTCGWTGPRRILRARSVLDAHLHAAQLGCQPAVPLIAVATTTGERRGVLAQRRPPCSAGGVDPQGDVR